MATIRLGRGRHRVIHWSGLRIRRAFGSWLEDELGRRYLDFFGASGVNLIGHSNPRVVHRVSEAISKRGIGAFPGVFEDNLVEKLAEILEGPAWTIELFSGGAEAVEAALRVSEEYTGRQGVIAFSGGFHGRTKGARSVTEASRPPVVGLPFAPYPDCERCPLNLRWPDCDYACAEKIVHIANSCKESVGAVIIEPLQGRSGNIPAPPGYLRRVRDIAHGLNALLVMDETLTGLGRTGRWLAHYGEDVVADLVIVGKGLGGGYPVSALIGRDEIMDAGSFGVPSGNSSSFGGFAAACAAADAALGELIDCDLIDRSRFAGLTLKSTLTSRLQDCPAIERISGRGMAVGMHFAAPWQNAVALRQFFDHCLQRRLLVMLGQHCVRLYPPLNIEESELWMGIDVLCEAAWEISGSGQGNAKRGTHG